MKAFFNQLLFLLDKPIKRQIPLLFLVFVISSIFEMVSLGLIGAFLMLVVNASTVLSHLPHGPRVFLQNLDKKMLITIVGSVIVSGFLFKAFLGIYGQKRILLVVSQFSLRQKCALMSAYQNVDYVFHLGQNLAYLMNKINVIDTLGNGVIMPALNSISSGLIFFGILFCLILIHPVTTILLCCLFGVLAIFYDFFLKKKLMNFGRVQSLAGGKIAKSIIQAMGGLKEIRVLGKESFFLRRMECYAREYTEALAANQSYQQIPRYVIESGGAIFLIFSMIIALWIGVDSEVIVPSIGVFAAACVRLLPTTNQLLAGWGQIRASFFATSVLYEEFRSLTLEYKMFPLMSDLVTKMDFKVFSFNRMSFCYPVAKKNTLNALDFSVECGQSIGLIGSSGAGKSTLVNLLLGLLAPSKGCLMVDNQPIKNQREWINNFAYIPQQIFLLDDTLKHNIALGSEDHEIDDQKLQNAIEMAQLVNVVAELPNGVDTVIGENGVMLSGGQRQRVALARAFYYEREIIILDEATSALDNETEKEVINSIKRLHGLKTMIVIAHRLTTIQHCDVVYKLEHGRIVKSGSFAEVVEA